MTILDLTCNEESKIKLTRTSSLEIQHNKYKMKDGTRKEYTYYSFTLPPYLYGFVNDDDDYTYFYIVHGKLYMCNTQPPLAFPQHRYKIRVRDIGSDVSFPSKLMSPKNQDKLEIILHMQKKDFITGEYGLVELKLV